MTGTAAAHTAAPAAAPAAAAAAPAKGRRRDAARNHEAVLDAGRAVLRDLGPDAGMEQIAARAGVGVGTVYRHFPSKEALLEALVADVTSGIRAAGDAAVARNDGHGLEQFLRVLGRAFDEHRTWAALLLVHTDTGCDADRIRGQLATLTATAKAAGTLGEHAEYGDVMVLVWAMRGVVETTGDAVPGAWERLLDLHLAALRAPAPPGLHRAVSAAEVASVDAHRRGRPASR